MLFNTRYHVFIAWFTTLLQCTALSAGITQLDSAPLGDRTFPSAIMQLKKSDVHPIDDRDETDSPRPIDLSILQEIPRIDFYKLLNHSTKSPFVLKTIPAMHTIPLILYEIPESEHLSQNIDPIYLSALVNNVHENLVHQLFYEPLNVEFIRKNLQAIHWLREDTCHNLTEYQQYKSGHQYVITYASQQQRFISKQLQSDQVLKIYDDIITFFDYLLIFKESIPSCLQNNMLAELKRVRNNFVPKLEKKCTSAIFEDIMKDRYALLEQEPFFQFLMIQKEKHGDISWGDLNVDDILNRASGRHLLQLLLRIYDAWKGAVFKALQENEQPTCLALETEQVPHKICLGRNPTSGQYIWANIALDINNKYSLRAGHIAAWFYVTGALEYALSFSPEKYAADWMNKDLKPALRYNIPLADSNT